MSNTIFVCHPFVFLGIFIFIAREAFLSGAVSTNGTIVSCNDGGQGTHFATIRFTAQKGQQITFQPDNTFNPCHVGEGVVVQYHPNDPQDAQVNDGLTDSAEFFIGIGALSLLIALLDLVLGALTGRGLLQERGPDHISIGR